MRRHFTSNLRQVERIDVKWLRILFRQDLYAHAPFREVTLLNRVEKIALRIVRIRSLHRAGLLAEKVLDPLLSLEVPLHVEQLILPVDQTERMAAVAVHVPVTVRCAAVGEENRHLV